MQLQTAKNITLDLFQKSLRTSHTRFMTLAALVAACYLPAWIGFLIHSTFGGSSVPILNIGAIVLVIQVFVQNREKINAFEVAEDDRFLGYGLTILGMVAFAYFRAFHSSISFQALSVMTIVIGMIWSSWGLTSIIRFPVTIFLCIASIYPDPFFITIRIFRFFTSENSLEQVMAQVTSMGLNLIGFQAVSNVMAVTLPQGSVLVGPACSGADMIFILMSVGFLTGKFMKLSYLKTSILMAFGLILAVTMNIPRLMLLAVAAVYWGKSYFDFWHGSIGGQIFAGLLFTLYYYGVEAILKYKKSTT
jgi:exosortase/archaeosortase family protein